MKHCWNERRPFIVLLDSEQSDRILYLLSLHTCNGTFSTQVTTPTQGCRGGRAQRGSARKQFWSSSHPPLLMSHDGSQYASAMGWKTLHSVPLWHSIVVHGFVYVQSTMHNPIEIFVYGESYKVFWHKLKGYIVIVPFTFIQGVTNIVTYVIGLNPSCYLY